MRRPLFVALAAASLLAPVAGTAASAAAPDDTIGARRVCAAPAAGQAACDAQQRTRGARPDATTSYQNGYSPSQLVTAYGLGSFNSSATVAIVDAFNNPNAASDLAAYRSQFHLGSANLTILNQNGVQGSYAKGDVGWGQEEMLDLEMVSAICPACPIIYVGANSANFSDLGVAVNTAAGLAKVVSNSYGGGEYSGEQGIQDSYYTHPGVTQTVSSGDGGYGVEIPAAFNTVVAVGGTSLTLTSPTGGRKTETAWSGAGSGCSALISKPAWQAATSLCSRRSVADVSAVADPNTGVAVYDSYGSTNGNWYVFGGTSVAAPLIGAVYALSGHAGDTAQSLYTNSSLLFDVKSGTNTRHCRFGYLCTSVAGYDGPTGNGTPNGSAAAF